MEQHKQGIYEKYIKRMFDIIISLPYSAPVWPGYSAKSCRLPFSSAGFCKIVNFLKILLHYAPFWIIIRLALQTGEC